MAASGITVCWETRPCEMLGYALPMYGIWHCWSDDNTKALIENEQGYLEVVDATRIRFLDGKEKFERYRLRYFEGKNV